MFGFENKPSEKFAFDLEKEMKEHPHRAKEILDKVEKTIQDIKKTLREGAKETEFDELSLLLPAYAALQKVLRKVK